MGQLTEHRPRWTGTHDTVQSPRDTMQNRHKKAQADTEAREGCRAAISGLTETSLMEGKKKGGKRGSVSWAPDLAKDLLSESVSDSVSNSLTDKVTDAQLDPVTAEVQDQAVETAAESDAGLARNLSVDASANPDTARPRRESTGEHRSQIKPCSSNPKQTWKNSAFAPLFLPLKYY